MTAFLRSLFLFIFGWGVLVAGWADPRADARTASQAVLEVYLDRAERSPTPQDWKAVSDGGLQAAQAAWERGAATWNLDAPTMAADRNSEHDFLSALVTQAWQTWLVNRFFQRVGTHDTLALGRAAAQADQRWLYQSDAQGNLVYDAAGNPVVLTKLNTDEDANDAGWKESLAAVQSQLLGAWDQGVQAALPELAAVAGGTDQRVLADLAVRVGEHYRNRYKQELDTLYQQQVARYTATRLYDQFSSKKKATDTTAGALVDQLIADVKAGTELGIQTVRTGLALAAEGVSADSQVNADQWQASFQQVLTAGLAKWDVAERQLLADRSDWETRAGTSYQTGEAAWAGAYNKLVQERTVWQTRLKELLAQGQAQWSGKKAELAQAIEEASARLDQQLAQEAQSKEQQVSGLVDVYAQAQNLVQAAQTSGEYWFTRLVDPLNHGFNQPYSWQALNTWASGRIGAMTAALRGQRGQIDGSAAGYNEFLARVSSFNANVVGSTFTGSPYGSFITFTTKTVARWQTVQTDRTHTDQVYATWQEVTDWNYSYGGALTKDLGVFRQKLTDLVARRDALTARIGALGTVLASLGQSPLTDQSRETLVRVEQLLGDDPANSRQESWQSYNEAAYWLLRRADYQTQADGAKAELMAGLQAVVGQGGDPQAVLTSSDLASGYLDEYQVALLKAQVQKAYWDRELTIARQVYAYATDTSSSRPTEAQQQEAWDRALADYQARKDDYAAAVAALKADGSLVATRQAAVEAAQTTLSASKATLVAAQGAYTRALSARASGNNTNFYTEQIAAYEQDLVDLYGLGTDPGPASLPARRAAYRAALRDRGYGQELVNAAAQLASLIQGPGTTLSLAQRQAQIDLLLASSDSQWYAVQTGRPGSGDTEADLEAYRTAAEGALLKARLTLACQAQASEDLTPGQAAAWQTAVTSLVTAGTARGWWTNPEAHRDEVAAAVAAVADATVRGKLKGLVGGTSADPRPELLTAERAALDRATLLQLVYRQGASSSLGNLGVREAAAQSALGVLLARQGWTAQGGALVVSPEAVQNSIGTWSANGTLEASTSGVVASIRALEPELRLDVKDAAETLALSILQAAALKALTGGAPASAQGALAQEAVAELTRLTAESAGQGATPGETLKRWAGLWTWARGRTDLPNLMAPLTAAFTAVLAAAVTQARYAVPGSDPDPWATALAMVAGALVVPQEVQDAAVVQARALDARLTGPGLATLASLAADPTSAGLGTVRVDTAHLTLAQAVWEWKQAHLAPMDPGAQDSLEEAYLDGLTSPGDRGYVTRLFGAWRAASSPGDSNLAEVLAESLVSGGTQALAAARSGGSLAEFRERALAVNLASQVSGPGPLGFLVKLLGMGTFGTIDASVYSSGQAYDATYTGFTSTDQALTDTVVGWYLKSQAVRGLALSAATRSRLSEVAQGEVEAFAGVLASSDGYIAGLGQSGLEYAAGLDAELATRNQVAQALTLGRWEDDFFLAQAAAAGADPGAQAGQVALGRLGQADLLLPQLGPFLLVALGEAQAGLAASVVRAEFAGAVQAWQVRIDDRDTGYRQYLTGALALTESMEDSALGAQAALEIEVGSQSLNAALGEASSTDRIAAFRSAYTRLTGPQANLTWTESDAYQIPAEVLNQYNRAVQQLNQTRAQVVNDQSQILRLGQIRDQMMHPKSDAELVALKAQAGLAVSAYAAAEKSLHDAMLSLAGAMASYNSDCQGANNAYQAAEEARFTFEAQDQLLTYAKNGYLAATDPTLAVAGYQGPTEWLASVQAMQSRAQTVFDTLKALNPSAQAATQGVSTADAAYTAATVELLGLTKLQDQLSSQLARQEVITQSYAQDYAKSVAPVVDNPGNLAQPENPWTPYLSVSAGQGLTLSVNFETFVLTPGDQKALTSYLRKDEDDVFQPGTFGAHTQKWLASMQQWQARDRVGYENRLTNWGLAFDYLLIQISNRNGSSAPLIQQAGVSGLVGTDEQFDAFLLANDGDLRKDIEGKGQNHNYTYLEGYRAWIKDQMAQAYNAVKDSPEFQTAVALRLAGGLKETGYFDNAAVQKTYQYIHDRAQGEADSHNTSAAILGGLASGYAAAGFAAIASFFGAGAAPYLFGMAAVFGGLASSQYFEGVQQQNAADIGSRGVRSYQTLITPSFQEANLNTLAARWNDYSRSWNTLQNLKGNPGGSTLTLADLERALGTALAPRGDTLGDQKNLLESHFGELSAEDKTDSATALAALVRLAAKAQTNANQNLQARFTVLQARFTADQNAYRTLEAQYLAGGTQVTLNQLRAQAAQTYQSPVYTALVQAQMQMAEDVAAAPATTPLTGYETRKAALVNRIADTLVQLEGVRLSHLKQVRLDEWSLKQTQLNRQQARWDNQMAATAIKAQQAWGESFAQLNSAYRSWQTNLAREYQTKAQTWSAVYQGFQTNRRQWVDEVAAHAGQAQSQVWAIASGQAADAAIGRSAFRLIGDLSGILTTDGVLAQVLAGNQLGTYLAAAQSINGGLATVSTSLRTGFRYSSGTPASLAAITQLQSQNTEELTQHASLIVAAQARDSLAAAQRAYKDQVVEANQSVDHQMDLTFVGSGFGKDGSRYHRRSIIGSTLARSLYEDQGLDSYRAFAVPSFSVTTTLDDASLQGLDARAVQARVGTVMDELRQEAIAVFGPGLDRFGNAIREGSFTKYLGFAPQLKANADLDTPDLKAGYNSSILTPGEGEEGRLIGWYQYFSLRASKGWAEQNRPFYQQKLFDDRGSFVKAPTLRDVAMTGVGIATTMATGGVGGAALLASAASTTGADALFTAADVGYGMDAGNSWAAFGKRASITGATSLLSMGLGGLGSAGASAAGSKLIGTTVNSLNWRDGHIGFDTDAFYASWDANNVSNYAGILSVMAGAEVSGGLRGLVSSDGLGRGLSGAWDKASLGSATDLLGGLASTAVGYGITGEATLNVANLSQFGIQGREGQALSYGLLQMHIGGSDGFTLSLGAEGTNISWDTLASSAEGLREGTKLGSAKIASTLGLYQQINEVNALNALGWVNQPLAGTNGTTTRELATSLIRGEVISSFTKMAGQDAGARGYVDDDDRGNIHLNQDNVGNDAQSAAQLAAVLAHEGTHVFGDVRGAPDERNAYLNGWGTYQGVIQAYGLQADSGFIAEQIGALVDPSTVGAGNTGHAYWKLTSDGKLQYDGQGYLRDEGGLYINSDGTRSRDFKKGLTIGGGGVETGLLNILYGGTTDKKYSEFSEEQKQAVQTLMGRSQLNSVGWGEGANWGNLRGTSADRELADANMDRVLDNDLLIRQFGSTLSGAVVFKQFSQQVSDLASGTMSLASLNALSQNPAWEQVRNAADKLQASRREVADSQGNKSAFYLPSEDSPILSQLYNQHSFPEIEALDDYGCNFMDVVATAAMIAGRALTKEQITEVWNAVAGEGKAAIVLLNDATVQEPDLLAQKVLDVLGRNALGVSYPRKDQNATGITAVAVRQGRAYDSKDLHFTLGTVGGKALYNPGFSSNDIQREQYIYVYKRN